MISFKIYQPPKNLAEAKNRWYGLKSRKYNMNQCAHEALFYRAPGVNGIKQCSRKNGHGPSDLYCKQHSDKMEKR